MFATRAVRNTQQLPNSAQQLYKAWQETANSFKSYNFKEYFLRQADRKFQAAFPFHASQQEQTQYLKQVQQDLAVLKRAALVNSLYEAPKLVVEKSVSAGEMDAAESSNEEIERGRDSI